MRDQVVHDLGSRRWARSGARVSGLLAAALSAVLVAGCAAPAASQSPGAPSPGTSTASLPPAEPTQVTIIYPSELTSQMPYSDSTTITYAFWGGIYESLVDTDGQDFRPVLAESWENPDELTWRFHLNPDAKFADGTKVTADDVVFSFDRIKNDPASVQAGTVDDIVEIVAVDEETVDFKSEEPLATMLVAVQGRMIQSKAYVESVGIPEADETPNGSGPYKLIEWRPGERYVLELRDDYWGKAEGIGLNSKVADGTAANKVIYRFISEPEAQVTALLNGEGDVLQAVPLALTDRINGSPNAHVFDVPSPTHFFFVLNPITDAMKKLEVRQAINHAIDVQGLIDGPLQGDATPLDKGPVLPSRLELPDITLYPYDPDRARALLATAGYADGLTIQFKCPSGQFLAEREICEGAAAMLEEVGITVELQNIEWSTFSTDYRTAADGALGYEMFFIRATPQFGKDVSQYDSWFECSERVAYCENTASGERFAKLYTQAKGELDENARTEAFREAFKVLMDDPPFVPLYLLNDHYGISNRLDYVPNGSGGIAVGEIGVKP